MQGEWVEVVVGQPERRLGGQVPGRVILACPFLSTIGVTAIALIFGAVTVAAAAAGIVTQLATARRTGLASRS